MDPLKNISLDVNRIILQLLIPGIFALYPYILLFANRFNNLSISDGYLGAIIFILSVSAGLVIEDFASQIESECWDKQNDSKFPERENEWNKYLKFKTLESEMPIAQKYLRTILIRMKFELSFAIALLIMIIGLCILEYYINFCQSCMQFWLVCIILPFSIACYQLYESKQSSILLIKIRKNIISD